MFPAPPRPALNFEDDAADGRPVSKREAGPRAVLGSEVFGALKVFPTPPRPECRNLEAVGWGSVMKYWNGMPVVIWCCGIDVMLNVLLFRRCSLMRRRF